MNKHKNILTKNSFSFSDDDILLLSLKKNLEYFIIVFVYEYALRIKNIWTRGYNHSTLELFSMY